MHFLKIILLCSFFVCFRQTKANIALVDTIPQKSKTDSSIKKKHNPKIALRRSAMLPGWGQVYNKQVWKVPIIYAALGITGYTFFDNLNIYKDVRFAYNARVKAAAPILDSSDLPFIKDYLKNLDVNSLNRNRRKFRQQIDYSVLFFVAFWGLNIADAVVFGHLKDFDVSDNLSASLKIGNSSIANTTGLNLNFDIHKKQPKKLFIVP